MSVGVSLTGKQVIPIFYGRDRNGFHGIYFRCCQIVCAVNLQYLKEIFKNVWAFVIANDAGNNGFTAYLDLQV